MHLFLDLLTIFYNLTLDDALDAEARPERAAAIGHGQIGVVEQGRAGVPQCRRSPARPR